MLIETIYVRFFRSFNFNYLRRAHRDYEADPWDAMADGRTFPFVRVPLSGDVTTVVGANESGKSQLLGALKRALSGADIKRSDFCRYSDVFAVGSELPSPDFGLHVVGLSPAELDTIGAVTGLSINNADSIYIFRFSGRIPTVFIKNDEGTTRHDVADGALLNSILPRWFEIDSQVALPSRVPLIRLTNRNPGGQQNDQAAVAISTFAQSNPQIFSSAAGVQQDAAAISEIVASALTQGGHGVTEAQVKLVQDLLIRVAGVNESAFEEILDSAIAGDDGYVNGLIERVNRDLAKGLNFPHWWSQDSQFRLLVSVRGVDLVLTIRDRTGTEYSFSERSGGMKYFLSYFVQYLAHEPMASSPPEVLLMDEPDAFLSSQGQQDMLRIFEDFAHPADPDRQASQVVYVTHSPFLIDKNHGERIRVLEKGEADEGTRVVRNAARNHYEPLRSALGAFVAETTFIGQCNLVLEGLSDQILLAAVSTWMTREHSEASHDNLNLNTITLVPAGSASQVPYLVYLATGRDVDRPAVIVLLDSDTSGNEAVATLSKGGPYQKALLKKDLVLQIGVLNEDDLHPSRPDGFAEIEDIFPAQLILDAAQAYVAEFLGQVAAKTLSDLNPSDLQFDGRGTHAVAQQLLRSKLGETFHLDKVGLARHVAELLTEGRISLTDEASLLGAGRSLFRRLVALQRTANRDITTEQAGRKVRRAVKAFRASIVGQPTREQAELLLAGIERDLANSSETDQLREEFRVLRREFNLAVDLGEPLNQPAAFIARVDGLSYLRELESQEESFNQEVAQA